MPMVDPRTLHVDCRWFRADRPCDPHKRSGVTCPTCTQYDPIRRRILVVKLAAVGDVLRTTALLPAIHAAFPGAKLTWLTAPSARALFAGNPLVDEVLTHGDARTAARLAVETFDVVLCPDADPDAAVLAAAARGRQRRGFSMDERGVVVPLGAGADVWYRMGLSDAQKRANTTTYQTLVARVLDLDPTAVAEPILEPSAEDRSHAQAFAAGLAFRGPWIGLNSGAGGRWTRKQWTLEHQIAFLTLATDRGYGVMLLGGPEERERHAQLVAATPGRAVVDAGTDNGYRRFAALVDLCAVVVTGDTFALHVATARRRHVVALFGPTSSAEIELYGRGEKIVPTDLTCLCCYLPTCDVDPHCQQRILPSVVLAAVERGLGALATR